MVVDDLDATVGVRVSMKMFVERQPVKSRFTAEQPEAAPGAVERLAKHGQPRRIGTTRAHAVEHGRDESPQTLTLVFAS